MGRRPPGLEPDKGYMTDYAPSSGPVLSAFVMREDGLAVHTEPCSVHNDNSGTHTHTQTQIWSCIYYTETIQTSKQISLCTQILTFNKQEFQLKMAPSRYARSLSGPYRKKICGSHIREKQNNEMNLIL